MIHNSKIIFTDETMLKKKIKTFSNSYEKHKNDKNGKKDTILVVTDFDFTLFNKYNYKTGEKYDSSYGMYNQDVFGGNQQNFQNQRKMLHSIYLKYEEDFTIDEKIKKEKINEWNTRALGYMLHPNFTRDSIRRMVEIKNEKNEIDLKKNVAKFYEKLIKLDIPIIIVSGGIKEIIIEFLKLLNIKGLEDYINKKRMLFIANEFIFDENNKCVDFNKDVIHGYNKSDHVKKLVDENFPNIENVFVLGDLDTDYKSIEKLNLDKNENIIGIGFLYYYPNDLKNKDFDYENNQQINVFKKIYDVNLLMDEGYDYPIELLNIIENDK
jgi:phosphoserine phosphatase